MTLSESESNILLLNESGNLTVIQYTQSLVYHYLIEGEQTKNVQ